MKNTRGKKANVQDTIENTLFNFRGLHPYASKLNMCDSTSFRVSRHI